jgi:two-component system, NtrC family, sensor kinase
MSLTRKATIAAKKPGKPRRQNLAAALAEREAELAEARRQQAATAEILRLISQSPTDVQLVFEAIATSANTLIGGFSTTVLRFVGDALQLAAFTPLNPEADQALKASHPRPLAEFPPVELVRKGQSVEFADTESEDVPPFNRQLARLRGYRSTLHTPLMSNGAAIGMVVVTRKEPGAFAAHQVQLLQTFADQAVIAIQNAKFFNETHEALRQQTATADVLKTISRSAFDLEAVFDALLASAVSLVGGRGGAICVRDGDVFRYRAVAEGRDSAMWRYLSDHPATPGRASVAGRVLLSGKPETIYDTLSDADLKAPLHSLTGSRSVVGVPLLRDDRVEGALMVGRAEAGSFDSRQIELLQTFADQAVIAIENVRLFEEVQARTRDLEESLQQQTATADVLKVISRSAFDLDTVLESLISTAMRLCNAKKGQIFRRDEDVYRYAASQMNVDPAYREHEQTSEITAGRGTLIGRVALENRAVQITDAWNDKEYLEKDKARVGGVRAMLGMPLMRNGEPIGAFALARDEPVPFTQRQVELVATFADQAVIAIENVRLVDEVQARTRDLEESLQRQTATADVLKVISRSAFDLQAVLNTLVRSAVSLCDASGGMIYLKEGDTFHGRAFAGYGEQFVRYLESNPQLPGRRSVGARVLLSGLVQNIPDLQADSEHDRHLLATTQHRAVLGVPLLRDKTIVGAIVLGRQIPKAFTQREIELVQTFADQAVIAIENVRLFDEVQARTRDLSEALQQQTATADVLKVISRSAFDLQAVFETLLNSAIALSGAWQGTICIRDGDVFTYRAVSTAVGTEEFDEQIRENLLNRQARADRTTLAGRAILSRKVEQIEDIFKDSEYWLQGSAAERAGVRSVLGVPLLRDDRVEGSLVLSRRQPGRFAPRVVELVQTFADQAVIAIENVRLFDEVQARTRDLEEALQQQTATADVLKVISRSTFDLQAVLDTLASSAAALCGAGNGLIYLRSGHTFEVKAATKNWNPETFRLLSETPHGPGRRTVGARVLLTGEVQNVADMHVGPDYEPAIRSLSASRALLGVPLKRGDAIMGAFVLARAEAGAYSQRQVELVQTFADQAVIAIENARLFDEVQAKTRELGEALQQQTATTDVLKVISRSAFDLKSVLTTLVESARRLCDAPQGLIFLRDGEVFKAEMQVGFTPEWDRYIRDNPIRPDPNSGVGRAALTGEVAHFPDVQAVPDYSLPEGVRIGGYRSVLAIPLKRENEVLGVFALTRPVPGPFTQRQIDLVRTFADQAVIAIENVRLFDEVRARTKDLQEALQQQTATADVLKVISRSAFDLKTVLDTLVISAARLCEAEKGNIFQRQGDLFHCVSNFGSSEEFSAYARAHPLGTGAHSVTSRVARDGRAVHIPDVLADPEYAAGEYQRLGQYRTILGVPLLRDGASVGSFALMRAEVRPFNDKQIELVQTFADQAVIAIENARLFDEVQAKTLDLEEALQQQTATANVLKVISRAAFDLQAVFDALISSAVSLIGSQHGTIYVRDGDGFHIRAHCGVTPEFVDFVVSNPPAPGLGSASGRVMLTGKVVAIPDILEDKDYTLPANALNRTRSMLAAPLLRNDRVEGVLVIARSEPGAFSARQIELVGTFADQAVIAIENARLFDEVQARTKDLQEALQQQTATADVLKVISRSAFDLQAVFDTLIGSAVELSGSHSGAICVRDGEIFRYRASSGPGATAEFHNYLVEHPATPGRGSIVGRAVLSRQVEEILDLREDAEYSIPISSHGNPARALLGVPLLGKERVEGAIALTRLEPGGFPSRQIEILRTFADQAVIAIENARLFDEVQARTKELAASLDDLRKAQDRLIQSEKLASLGQLTAGIAHEIKNPLNFINNYSALSRELVDELAEAIKGVPVEEATRNEADELIGAIGGNLDKVVQHGKRADSIVKNMLLHSREGSGERSMTNINAMVEEALNLAYHGARAEKPGFNVTIAKSLDPNAGAAEIYAQEMTRVLLNLIGNGFYATAKRKQSQGDSGYEPTISASTRDRGPSVEIAIRDNGTGISDEVKAKMFNPFFTTKPAGEGTGLGLSLSHDIVVKQHGGTIEVSTEPGAFTQFAIVLPRGGAAS